MPFRVTGSFADFRFCDALFVVVMLAVSMLMMPCPSCLFGDHSLDKKPDLARGDEAVWGSAASFCIKWEFREIT